MLKIINKDLERLKNGGKEEWLNLLIKNLPYVDEIHFEKMQRWNPLMHVSVNQKELQTGKRNKEHFVLGNFNNIDNDKHQ